MSSEELEKYKALYHNAIDEITGRDEKEKRNKATKRNFDFVQLSRTHLRDVADLGTKSPMALKVLMMLAQVMDKQNAVMISYSAMENILGRTRPTIDRAIRILRDDKWIQVVKVGTANAYVLNSGVFWTDSSDKKLSVGCFSAQVITTLEEQTSDLRKNKDVKLKKITSLLAKERASIDVSEDLPPPDQLDMDLN